LYTQFSGRVEAIFRSVFVESNPTAIRQFFEKAGSLVLGGAKLLDYHHLDPLDFTRKFDFTSSYSVDRIGEVAGDTLILPNLEEVADCVAADTEERTYPIVLDALEFSKDEVRLSISKGYRVQFLPEKVEMVNPYFEYRSSYYKEGSEIVVKTEFINTAALIAPEDYARYRSCCQAMRETRNNLALLRRKK
jgi:hypothetical protein